MNINLTFGELLILVSIGVSVTIQYLSFSNRLSKFEGYTKAKIEMMEKFITDLLNAMLKHMNDNG